MAHEIEFDKFNQPRMMYAKDGGIPWHGLGTAVETATDSATAGRLAGLDGWDVTKCPIEVILPDGTHQIVADQYATVRASDNKVMGLVTKDYQVFSNEDAFGLLDRVMADAGMEAKYETAGSLYGGKQVFMTLRLPDDFVVGDGDRQFPYLLLRTGHDGATALDILPTVIRPVCANTVGFAMKARGSGWGKGTTMWHMGDIDSKAAEVEKSLGMAIAKLDDYRDAAQKMIDIAATRWMTENVIDALLPPIVELRPGRTSWKTVKTSPGRWEFQVPADALEKVTATRAARVEIFKAVYAEETPTAWGLWSAATGYADHQRPHAWRRAETRMASTLWGSGAEMKERAYEAIRKVAKV